MSTSVSAPLEWDRSVRQAALTDLRAIRRHNRVARVDRFDAFYKAYVSGIAAVIAVYALAGLFGDAAVTGKALQDVKDLAPVYLGLAVALAIAVGMRSGGRGGPLAFERADVRHVLLAPVAREDAIRSVASRGLRHAIFLGASSGGVLGIITARRLPGSLAEWILGGALFMAAVAVGYYGIALLFSGLRVNRLITDVLALAVLAWAATDAVLQISTSPFAWISHVALWPLEFSWLGFVGILVMFVIGAAGLWAIPGWSMEAAERRSRLVGQLRFAATMQDIRTVMVIQRQLAQEHLRSKPLIRLPRLRKSFDRKGQPLLRVFARRSLHTLLRWSAFRLLRLLGLAVIAGFAVLGAWAGTTPLLVVAGIALWLMAIDLLEPLAQESDHPDRMAGSSRIPGWVMLRLVFVPIILQFMLVALGSIPLFVYANAQQAEVIGALWLPTVVLCTLLPMGGAALAVTRQPSIGGGNITSPEITGLITLWRLAGPPAIAVSALIPFAIAKRDFDVHHDLTSMQNTMSTAWYIVFAVGAWSVAWVRVGAEMKNKISATTAEAAADQAKKNGDKK